MLSVLALGMGPNPAGTYSETEAEPETAGTLLVSWRR